MAVISKKETKSVSFNIKIYKNLHIISSKIVNILKKSLAWIFRAGKNLGHLLFYHRTEPNDKTAKQALLKHQNKVNTTIPNYRIPRILR